MSLDNFLVRPHRRYVEKYSAGDAWAKVDAATSEGIINSLGDPALRITIVLAPGAAASISGEAVLKTLAQISDTLQEQGEERFPILHYATSDELEELAEASD
jgi:hypothetical protein